MVEYTYDSWGKPLSCTGTLATTLGALNPFRYRGYVYDEETGFYYLKSRYYDPETCRFISADVLLSTGQGVIGYNAYTYCLNNPVMMTDSNGHSGNIYETWISTDTGREVPIIGYERKPDKYYLNEEHPDISEYITSYALIISPYLRVAGGPSYSASGSLASNPKYNDASLKNAGGGTPNISVGLSFMLITEKDAEWLKSARKITIGGSIKYFGADCIIAWDGEKSKVFFAPSIGYAPLPAELHAEYSH